MSRRSARLVKKESDESAPSLPRMSSSTSKAKSTTTTKKRPAGSNNVKVEADVKAESGETPLPVLRASPSVAKPGAKRRKAAPEAVKAEAPVSLTTAKPPATLAKTKGRRRGLKMIAEMPVDVLLEIFQYLDPADLLNLSRTDRTLRAYVLKRTVALPWWKAAFERVDPKPPKCPEGMSLPQYANLLYGRTCFYCSASHGLTRSWSAYLRACKKCLDDKQLFVTFTERPPRNTHEYNLFLMNAPVSKERGDAHVFLRREFEKHREQLIQLASQSDKSKYTAYAQDAGQVVDRRLTRARVEFHAWDAREKLAKEEELKARRTNRKDAILQKLEELGYIEIVNRFKAADFLKIPGVNAVTLLTDKEWERVKPGILSVLNKYQTDIDCKKRRELISRRTALLEDFLDASLSQNRHLDLPEVPASQLAKLEPFRSIIYDTPEGKELKVKTFMKHFDEIPAVLQAWKAEAEEVLLNLIQASSASAGGGTKGKKNGKAPALGVETLNLAITIFWCKWCGKHYPTTYPSVLTHRCLFERHPADKAADYHPNRNPRLRQIDREIVYLDDEDKADANPGWNQGGDQLIFFEDASKFASAIITALGADPSTATWEELDAANERLECLYCRLPRNSKENLKGLAMDWRQAVLHQLNAYNNHLKIEFQLDKRKNGVLKYNNSWKKLSPQLAAKVFKKEVGNGKSDDIGSSSREQSLYCTACAVVKLKPDGRVIESSKYKQYNAVKPQSKKCSEGHDLKKTGTFTDRFSRSGWYDQSFRCWPHPVKIP